MGMHRLHSTQSLPISLDEAWEFFSAPQNLAKITPPEMGFIIHSGAERKMYAGQIIQYTVKPLAGIPMKWVTEISAVNEPHHFVDTQLSGPYVNWHHQHFFRAIKGGVEMEDIVHYRLPLGFLGDIVHWMFVRKKVQQIFTYREKVLKERFGSLPPAAIS